MQSLETGGKGGTEGVVMETGEKLGGAVTKHKRETWKTRGQACQRLLRSDGNENSEAATEFGSVGTFVTYKKHFREVVGEKLDQSGLKSDYMLRK